MVVRHIPILIGVFLLYLIIAAPARAQSSTEWYMAGANLQRTSWLDTSTANQTEISGNLDVDWYRPIEPHIHYKVQPVFANGLAYITTAKGIYAINTTNGDVAWVYPTFMPLGHTPTVVTVNGKSTLYVGGYDKKIHAIDAAPNPAVLLTDPVTGFKLNQPLAGYIPYIAGAGFETNPLITTPPGGSTPVIYAGNRDGYFYALDAVNGSLKWRFQTQGPILFSAAMSQDKNRVYVASNDLYAYALNASTGTLIWKSIKFPTAGFHTFWPVVYTEKATNKEFVVFTAADIYRNTDGVLWDTDILLPACHQRTTTEPCPANGEVLWTVFPQPTSDSYFPPGTIIMDLNRPRFTQATITNYYEQGTPPTSYPYRRTVYMLDSLNGTEYTYDSDNDGIAEYAPFTASNVTGSGTKYPALTKNGILYNTTIQVSLNWIPRGDLVGWQLGTAKVSRLGEANAIDEPKAFAGAGNLVYWALLGDREAGAFNITIPYGQSNRLWQYYGYNLITNEAPDYKPMYHNGDDSFYNTSQGWDIYSGQTKGRNGVYSNHMNSQSPPIPYQGKLFMLKGNTLLAWKSGTVSRTKLALAPIVNTTSTMQPVSPTELQQTLEAEIKKFDVDEGGNGELDHFKPGHLGSGFIDNLGQGGSGFERGFGEILDYYQNPSETVVTLLQTLPHLNTGMKDRVRSYLQKYYGPNSTHFPITSIVHIGWQEGANRQAYDIPPDIDPRQYTNFAKSTTPRCKKSICGWSDYPPYSFYAAYKYAQEFGGAVAIFNSISTKLETPTAFLADEFTTYINGSATYTTSLNGIGNPINDTTAPLYLGGDTANNYNGGIDDVKIYDRALTHDQVTVASQNICAAGSANCIQPVAHWQFNEGSGNTIHNSSSLGSVLDGTLTTATSSAMWSNAGKYGNALHFDGLDDTVTINPHPSINLYEKTGYTLCSWVYPYDAGEGRLGEAISKGASYVSFNTYNANMGMIRIASLFDLDMADASYNMVSYIPVRQWTHVCVVWLPDSVLAKPYVLNQFLAGYYGYLELAKLAGIPDTDSRIVTARNTYNSLLNTRMTMFSKDNPFPKVNGATSAYNYMDALAIARNFMYLTPELAAELNKQVLSQTTAALNEYQYVAPYWFVTKFDAGIGEGTIHHLYDYPSLFQAKARILKESREELFKYLDVPAFPRGDLFYIQNLVAVLEAPSDGSPTATPILTATPPSLTPTAPAGKPGDANADNRVDGLDYVIWLNHYGTAAAGPANGNFNDDSRVDGLDYVVWLNHYGA